MQFLWRISSLFPSLSNKNTPKAVYVKRKRKKALFLRPPMNEEEKKMQQVTLYVISIALFRCVYTKKGDQHLLITLNEGLKKKRKLLATRFAIMFIALRFVSPARPQKWLKNISSFVFFFFGVFCWHRRHFFSRSRQTFRLQPAV